MSTLSSERRGLPAAAEGFVDAMNPGVRVAVTAEDVRRAWEVDLAAQCPDVPLGHVVALVKLLGVAVFRGEESLAA